MEQRWNNSGRGKPKDSERNLSQCHFKKMILLRSAILTETVFNVVNFFRMNFRLSEVSQ
jgi:hypothetical protein